MTSSFKSALVLTAVTAIALTSFDLRPAAATPAATTIAKQNAATEFSAARKKRRYRGNPFPYAAVGAIIGGIANIAAAQSRQAYYYGDGPYVDGPVVYEQPQVYYDQPYVYDEPTYYASPTYVAPGGYGYHQRRFVSPGPVHRPFVGHAPAPRQFVQRNFVRPQGGGGRPGVPGRPHNRH